MPLSGEAKRIYQRDWIKHRRDAWFLDKVCVICKSKVDLQVDHIDPDKKVSHRIWSWSAERREKELAKCQVLCLPCHQAKTAQYRREHLSHGSKGGYDRGCRCGECRTFYAAWRKLHQKSRMNIGV